ncbi:MAG: hypothetical protein COB66_04465 [Coxiella sp. (in: Bacteria)]|nr:MAG: hypothetical protein COB66_04465 [Coxiella sp. (in: g-proteobacteria)]
MFLCGRCYLLRAIFKLHLSVLTRQEYFLLIGAAISATLYQLYMAKSLRHLSPSTVSPLLYLAVLFGCIADYFVWHIVPHWFTFVGFVLIFMSTLFSVLKLQKAAVASR